MLSADGTPLGTVQGALNPGRAGLLRALVAQQVGRVDDHDDGVRTAIAGDVARQRIDDDLLIGRGRRERVESREIDELDLLPVAEVARARLAGDGDAGVIADALTQARQGVEESRLAGVGVTDERDQ